MDNAQRAEAWRRNDRLEEWLKSLSELMGPAQALCNERAEGGAEPPIVLVVGAPRSGTTLMMQSIAAGGLCAYPTNVLGRFYAAPGVGARIQRLLFDEAFRFRDEFFDLAPEPPGFSSKLGKTRGALAPNEFWYFWRRFLPTSEIEPVGARLSEVDMAGLRAELRSVGAAFERPFATKGMMLQYDIEAFGRALPGLFFLHVERDVAANASSLLDARKSFFDTEDKWYSAKPPEYEELKERPAVDQVVGQVEFTNRAIRSGTDALGPERSLRVPYAEFCAEPGRFHDALRERLVALAPSLADALAVPYTGPASFTPTRVKGDRTRAEEERMAAIQDAIHRISQ